MRNTKENGIQQIRLRNFKVFRKPVTFHIRGRHMLVYGPNGSGKSSLYWALYTLLQSITKEPRGTNKYFEFEGKESLLNINEPKGAPSYVFVSAMVDGKGHRGLLSPQQVRVDGVPMNARPYSANWLAEANQAAEFINHRQLIGFYNFANSEPIDLLGAFEGNFYPLIMQEKYARTKTLQDLLHEIESELKRIRRLTTKQHTRLTNGAVQKLNEEFGMLVNFLNANVNQFLIDNFKENNLRVKLKPQGAYAIVKQGATWVLLRPSLFLTIDQLKADTTAYHDVDRPQSFLNEALLTRVGVAIRFTLLPKRLQKGLRLMLMDDLLISMDMDNRSELFKTIERLYQDDYQLFIFTHDRGLYNELRRKVDDDVNNWAIYEVNKGEFRNAKTELEKAKAFLEYGDYDACALELRKLSEILLRQYLKGIDPKIFDDKKFRSLGVMLEMAFKALNEKSLKNFEEKILELKLSEADILLLKQDDFTDFIKRPIPQNQKRKVLMARTALFDMAEYASQENRKALNFLRKVQDIKDRILNIGAHPTDEPLYRTEMEEAVEVFSRFKDTLFATS